MKIRGVDYDLGVLYAEGISSRPTFHPAMLKREIEIIQKDLHCNAIRLCGQDIQRLSLAGEWALDRGLKVWFAPRYMDASEQEMLPYLEECAQAAEELRRQVSEVVFVLGAEFTLLMKGILDGATLMERLSNPANWERFKRGEHNGPLNDFLAKAAPVVRQHFHGPLTYASLPLEKVDWSGFDFVGLDHYREARNRHLYSQTLERYFSYGKPVVVTELGCCAYQGAEDQGARGWEAVDYFATPPQIKGNLTRDEGVQAREIAGMLQILEAAKVEGAFVYTFVAPAYPYDENPKFDLDMASYGLVKSFTSRLGTTYPDMPWEPKEAFWAVAQAFGKFLNQNGVSYGIRDQ